MYKKENISRVFILDLLFLLKFVDSLAFLVFFLVLSKNPSTGLLNLFSEPFHLTAP